MGSSYSAECNIEFIAVVIVLEKRVVLLKFLGRREGEATIPGEGTFVFRLIDPQRVFTQI